MRRIDSHTHLMSCRHFKLLEMVQKYHYERFCTLSIPCYGSMLNNLECLYLKKLAPDKSYVYGGITYWDGKDHSPEDALQELIYLREIGFDGWKILESKPSVYRTLHIPLDGDMFSQCFTLAEKTQFPVIWHSGDPDTFWSADTAPSFAVEHRWLCVGEGYPTLGTLDQQAENVLKAHPSLQVTLAHLFFTSDRRELGERLLQSYPNLWLDITPGSEMYCEFMKDPNYWHDYFLRYQDRLVYGTDMEDDEGDVVFGSQQAIVDMMMSTLVEGECCSLLGTNGKGLALPNDVKEKLFAKNFLKRNPVPAKINLQALNEYGEWLLQRLPDEYREPCNRLLSLF